ncbi:hypothetical protein ACFSZS_12220 [Seohaeicola zhoushanensis]
MKDFGVVFLDYPGLPLPSGTSYPRSEHTKEAIVRGERYAEVAYRSSDRVGELMAEVAALDLGNTRWSKRRELALGWINGLYHEVKAGDLVVLPGPIGPKDNEVRNTLVGEVFGLPERWRRRPNLMRVLVFWFGGFVGLQRSTNEIWTVGLIVP